MQVSNALPIDFKERPGKEVRLLLVVPLDTHAIATPEDGVQQIRRFRGWDKLVVFRMLSPARNSLSVVLLVLVETHHFFLLDAFPRFGA
ncbi:MAG: hypothetical protein BWY59_01505 [Verrucomicrobia bacterium ADurb.Bin345]|nr:MAG: hypothetical protein BWY59_01505 [Verrucomicrobia bacterium ADurb.Bin345]